MNNFTSEVCNNCLLFMPNGAYEHDCEYHFNRVKIGSTHTWKKELKDQNLKRSIHTFYICEICNIDGFQVSGDPNHQICCLFRDYTCNECLMIKANE